jgi:hypothetical protein
MNKPASEIEACKLTIDKWLIPAETGEYFTSTCGNCPLCCYYGVTFNDGSSRCSPCPLKHCSTDSIFDKWARAKHPSDAAKLYATQIINACLERIVRIYEIDTKYSIMSDGVKQTEPTTSKMKPTFLIMVSGMSLPSKIHTDQSICHDEMIRLAKLNPNLPVIRYRSDCYVKVNTPAPEWEGIDTP